MEKYRGKVKRQVRINAAAAVILIAVQVLAFSRVLKPVTADAHWKDMWNGFIAGASFGLMALFIVGIIQNIRALMNEKVLKKLYIKENDEREKNIATEARSVAAQIFLVGGLLAGIIAGYFSVAVSITFIACVFAHSLVCGMLKLWFRRKY